MTALERRVGFIVFVGTEKMGACQAARLCSLPVLE